MIFPDVCSITPITKDVNLGVETRGTAFNSSCKVERENILTASGDGVKTSYGELFLLPAGTDISTGDEITIVSISNMPVTESSKEVDKIFPVGFTSVHHLEVTIK